MIIIPPELEPYNSRRYYYSDIAYRQDVDNERIADRAQHLVLLLHDIDIYDAGNSFPCYGSVHRRQI